MALIYGKQHLDMFPALCERLIVSLKGQLLDMPAEPVTWRARERRLQSLNELSFRLQAITKNTHD